MKLILLVICILPLESFAFYDTAILASIMTNTTTQISRLEKIATGGKEQLGLMKDLKEYSEQVKDLHDTITDVSSEVQSIVDIGTARPEDLEGLVDVLEQGVDGKERLERLAEKARKADQTSKAVVISSKENQVDLNRESSTNRKQLDKSFGGGSVKNQNQVTAQNTGLINSKLSLTNSLLKKQNQNSAEMNQVIVADIVNREKDRLAQEEFFRISNKKRN